MRRLVAAVAVVLACAACQSGDVSDGNVDDVEKTLSSIEADLNQP